MLAVHPMNAIFLNFLVTSLCRSPPLIFFLNNLIDMVLSSIYNHRMLLACEGRMSEKVTRVWDKSSPIMLQTD